MRGERECNNVVENSYTNNEVLKSAGVGCSQDNAAKDIPFVSVPRENGVSRKKPFNILRDKHKPKPKSVSPEDSRPKKRSRLMLEDSFDRFGILGRPYAFKSQNGNEEGAASGVDISRNFDLNDSDAGSGGDEVRGGTSSGGDEVRGEVPVMHPHPLPDVAGDIPVVTDDGGSELLKEINATVILGKNIGVELRNFSSLVREAIVTEGNNVVYQ
ncbi:hypothetical protein Hanom_Chr00s000006g01613831 [Helianthus anomalus]